MYNLDFTPEQLVAVYRNTSNEGRTAIKEALGDKLSEALPITERVKTYQDDVRELGEKHPYVEFANCAQYRYPGILGADIVAYLKLRVIVAALNEGWEPKFTEGELRWYGWYDIVSKAEYDAMSDDDKAQCRCVGRSHGNAHSSGGLVCAGANSTSSHSGTYLSARLAFKSEELAEYAAKQFAELFGDFCFLPKPEKETEK